MRTDARRELEALLTRKARVAMNRWVVQDSKGKFMGNADDEHDFVDDLQEAEVVESKILKLFPGEKFVRVYLTTEKPK